jgi:hypothetical protein
MKNIFYILLVMTNICNADQIFDCKTVEPKAESVYQELEEETTAACIFSKHGSEATILSFYKKNKNGFSVIETNSSLIDRTDTIPTLESTGDDTFQIMFYYPRDTYSIEIKSTNTNISVMNTYKSIEITSKNTSENPKGLVFILKKSLVEQLKFSTITNELAFNSSQMIISQESIGTLANISSDRAYLYRKAEKKSKTNAYLIKGDEVEILDYQHEHLLIDYKKAKGNSIQRWISLIDIL